MSSYVHEPIVNLPRYITLLKQAVDPLAVSDPKNMCEFTPIPLSFTTLKAIRAKEEREQRKQEKSAGGASSAAALSADTSLLASESAGSAALDSLKGIESLGQKSTASARAGEGGMKDSRMRAAGMELISAMGRPEERRAKAMYGSAEEVVEVAVDEMRRQARLRKERGGAALE